MIELAKGANVVRSINKDRRPRRPLAREGANSLDQKKILLICVEGETEQAYFNSIASYNHQIYPVVFPGNNSSPQGLLSAAISKVEEFIKKKGLKPSDEAWLVLDRDEGERDEAILDLYEWAKLHRNRYIALSVPNFELWILAHFQGVSGISTKTEVKTALDSHISNYKKGNASQLPISVNRISQAVSNISSKLRECPEELADFDGLGGVTSVHMLVQKMISDL
ncbi:RloB family protein [Corynebacterium sp. MSK151]|uniref:RloB family protein n=1 Tax=unclassified Corynebacterium TaxID=2624378 RepID=UPI00254C064C|nr:MULTISPECIES: RloB family protein [unclassified Corynebacterium]MDK8759978.1 RloB family protein [Corynebacterium sp. MSK151]MDK8848970.1 RloB family protein [Corynebacterium sp. MSK047]